MAPEATQEERFSRDVYRNLKAFFTEKEKVSLAEGFAAEHSRKVHIENDFDSVKKQYQTDLKRAEAEISSIAERLNTGWEMRRVECVETKDWRTGTITLVRKDTGEIVEERAMTGEERQAELALKDKESCPTENKAETTDEKPSADEQGSAGQEIEGGLDVGHGPEKPENGSNVLETHDLPEDTNLFYTGLTGLKMPENVPEGDPGVKETPKRKGRPKRAEVELA